MLLARRGLLHGRVTFDATFSSGQNAAFGWLPTGQIVLAAAFAPGKGTGTAYGRLDAAGTLATSVQPIDAPGSTQSLLVLPDRVVVATLEQETVRVFARRPLDDGTFSTPGIVAAQPKAADPWLVPNANGTDADLFLLARDDMGFRQVFRTTIQCAQPPE